MRDSMINDFINDYFHSNLHVIQIEESDLSGKWWNHYENVESQDNESVQLHFNEVKSENPECNFRLVKVEFNVVA